MPESPAAQNLEETALAISDDAVGRVLGHRYRLVAPVGSGASARVYLAEDLSLGRQVAVKCLRPGLSEDPRFLRRFRAEAKAAAQLSHPNLMAVFDWGEHPTPYLVTEILLGGSLLDLLARSPRLSLSQGLLIGLQVAQGLNYAHGLGIVHRDVKPANLLFGEEGRLRLGDFGIARAVAEAAWTEPEGVLVGTARYAAPEQALGEAIDGKADVYSLALTVIEVVTGRVPLLRENALATMVLRQDRDVVDLTGLGPLGAALVPAGRADPGARPSAAELIDALTIAARSLPRPDRLPLVRPVEVDAQTRDGGEPTGEYVLDDDRATVEAIVDLRPPTGSMHQLWPGNQVKSIPIPIPAPGPEPDADPVRPDDEVTPVGRLLGGEPAGDSAQKPLDEPPEEAPGSAFSIKLARIAPSPIALDVEPPAKRRWPLLAAAALAAIAVLGAAVWVVVDQGVFTADPAPATTIPAPIDVAGYIGLGVAEIVDEVEANGWELVVTERREDGTKAGVIIGQEPAVGGLLERGSILAVEVSIGPELRPVPEVIGLTVEDASSLLRSAELELGVVTSQNDDEMAEGEVLLATIGGAPATPEAETGTAIDLVVSAGPVADPMPSFVGLNLATALEQAADLGLIVTRAEAFTEVYDEGFIVDTTPPTNTLVTPGDQLTLVVSLGPPFIVVPDVVGLDPAGAADALIAAGFAVTDTVGPPNLPVIATVPAAGESHRKGSAVVVQTAVE